MGWTWQSDGPEGMPYLVWSADAPAVSASSPTTAPPPAPAAAAGGASAPGMFDDSMIRKLQGQSDAPAAPSLWEAPSGSMTGQQAYGEQQTYRDPEGQVWAINPATGMPERMMQGYHGDGLSDFFDVSGNAASGGGLDPYEGFHYYFESDPNLSEDALARGFKIKSSDKEKQRSAMMGNLVLGGLTAIAGASLPGMLGFGAAPAMTTSELAMADMALGGAGGSAGASGLAAAGAGAGGAAGGLAGYARPAAQIGLNTLRSGDFEQALESYVMGAGMDYGFDVAAPYVNAGIDWGSDFAFGEGSSGGMLPQGLSDDSMNVLGEIGTEKALEAASDPMNWGAGLSSETVNTLGEIGTEKANEAATDPANWGAGGAVARGALATESPATQSGSQLTGDDLQRYVKTAQKVDELLGALEGAPTRDEGETDEQHQQELVDYLGLDSATMAEAGLVPGTPEYMEFILSEADAIIERTMGDLDVDSEDFAAQLRSKTAEEQQELQRALYVRGQMDLMMGSGTYTDPFSGTEQEVEGESFNPSVAASQRGRASEIDALAGMEGEEALDFLKSLLGRETDLFGMQGRADERFELAKRNEQDELRKRRGMFSY